ncbi:hypothetical protein QQP08_003504 [Theobroma cacao]|nr:hypothetical protein QQP08_003504 [Theobroma cacao]
MERNEISYVFFTEGHRQQQHQRTAAYLWRSQAQTPLKRLSALFQTGSFFRFFHSCFFLRFLETGN